MPEEAAGWEGTGPPKFPPFSLVSPPSTPLFLCTSHRARGLPITLGRGVPITRGGPQHPGVPKI